LAQKIKETEAEIEIQKATHQYLLKMLTSTKQKKVKEGLVETSSEYLDKAELYAASLNKLSRWQ
jgi:hypothetical protein